MSYFAHETAIADDKEYAMIGSGNTLDFDESSIATDSFDNSKYKIQNNNLILIKE